MEETLLLLAGCCHPPVISEMLSSSCDHKGMVLFMHAELAEQREGKKLEAENIILKLK